MVIAVVAVVIMMLFSTGFVDMFIVRYMVMLAVVTNTPFYDVSRICSQYRIGLRHRDYCSYHEHDRNHDRHNL